MWPQIVGATLFNAYLRSGVIIVELRIDLDPVVADLEDVAEIDKLLFHPVSDEADLAAATYQRLALVATEAYSKTDAL